MVLGDRLADVPEAPLAPEAIVAYPTWRPIRYEEEGAVGYLHFPFYNGAMGTAQCEALARGVSRTRKSRPTRVIVLMGGPDFWSNGIHLNLIEASAHPAEESWRNINAMDDLVREIVVTDAPAHDRRDAGQRGRGRRFPGAGGGSRLRPRRRRSSIRTTRAWATCTAPNTGPTCCRAASAPTVRARSRRAACRSARAGATAMGLIDDHFGATPAAFRAEVEARRTRSPPTPRSTR